ncbi:uncharacterized protein LOC123291036 isoform X1 [Chrysoperla carnea]|uniref:uncharacterized protein LOC123291036 isoform X1 n=1 Tax=Chrysoperla carnea TaxID=189513 RepID=UPI001D0786AC|nr:uncharacterized protein LOC123291036 isoform X1 [Chrysoperla carnea]
MAVILKGWRFAVFLGVIVGGIGLTLYPVVIDPMISADKYSKKNSRGSIETITTAYTPKLNPYN